jgi:hypothetical protein
LARDGARLGALRHDDVDALLLLALRVRDGACQRRHLDAVVVRQEKVPGDPELARGAEAGRDHLRPGRRGE